MHDPKEAKDKFKEEIRSLIKYYIYTQKLYSNHFN